MEFQVMQGGNKLRNLSMTIISLLYAVFYTIREVGRSCHD